jgi:DNA-binding CsgD family transcriptional regulator/ArsR family metal-binding transcriptional regulator
MIVTEYANMELKLSGVRPEYLPMPSHAARFDLDADVSALFPLLNAEIPGAQWFETPDHVRFCHNLRMCNLFARQAVAGPVSSMAEAHAMAAEFIDFLNALYARRAAIEPDFRRVRPVSVVDAFRALPRTNCGRCGFASCFAFAAALRRGEAEPHLCHALQAPVRRSAEYAVRDAAGHVISTVSLDVRTPCPADPAPQPTPTGTPFEDLTPRQTQVLRLLARGATNTTIASQLNISPHTVKSHVIHIFNKLGVSDRTSAAVWAAQNHVV